MRLPSLGYKTIHERIALLAWWFRKNLRVLFPCRLGLNTGRGRMLCTNVQPTAPLYLIITTVLSWAPVLQDQGFQGENKTWLRLSSYALKTNKCLQGVWVSGQGKGRKAILWNMRFTRFPYLSILPYLFLWQPVPWQPSIKMDTTPTATYNSAT